MRWKQHWPDRPPRPKVQPLSSEERNQTLKVFQSGIEASPVLSALGISVSARRGRFYFERTWPATGEQPQVEAFGRATPLQVLPVNLLLEAERRPGNWHAIVQGSAQDVMSAIAGDTKGVFHGLGALDARLREMKGGSSRCPVRRLTTGQFVFEESGEDCTFHETLFFFSGSR